MSDKSFKRANGTWSSCEEGWVWFPCLFITGLVKSLAAMKAKGQAAKSTPEKNQP